MLALSPTHTHTSYVTEALHCQYNRCCMYKVKSVKSILYKLQAQKQQDYPHRSISHRPSKQLIVWIKKKLFQERALLKSGLSETLMHDQIESGGGSGECWAVGGSHKYCFIVEC